MTRSNFRIEVNRALNFANSVESDVGKWASGNALFFFFFSFAALFRFCLAWLGASVLKHFALGISGFSGFLLGFLRVPTPTPTQGASAMSSSLPCKVTKDVGCGVSELYQRFQCDYCQEDIPGLRVRCADCHDFDLCLPCFACGAQIGKHKNTHKYIFMNNGGFAIFPEAEDNEDDGSRRRKSVCHQLQSTPSAGSQESDCWNAREAMRLLDAVEQYGYGNWKDIAGHVETKTPEQTKEEYVKHFIHGLVGKHTWHEELRGYAVDHTANSADRGPLSPTLTGKLPPIAVSSQEALLLGYMPHRDDFEDFEREMELLVAQIADKSVQDEDVDVALKLAQCDIYERRLREEVRRKRVARDYQLVSKFYRENPIVQIGALGKVSPTKISNQVKAVKKGDGPRQGLFDSLRPMSQYFTAQEFSQFVSNLCVEKELKVRVKELQKYRHNGLTTVADLVPYECARFKRELKLKRLAKMKMLFVGKLPPPGTKFLPAHGDYCLKAILNPSYEEAVNQNLVVGRGIKKKAKKLKWSRKKEKTGRRLLLQQGCILTLASPARRDSTDSRN